MLVIHDISYCAAIMNNLADDDDGTDSLADGSVASAADTRSVRSSSMGEYPGYPTRNSSSESLLGMGKRGKHVLLTRTGSSSAILLSSVPVTSESAAVLQQPPDVGRPTPIFTS
jgi:hypothetical protein